MVPLPRPLVSKMDVHSCLPASDSGKGPCTHEAFWAKKRYVSGTFLGPYGLRAVPLLPEFLSRCTLTSWLILSPEAHSGFETVDFLFQQYLGHQKNRSLSMIYHINHKLLKAALDGRTIRSILATESIIILSAAFPGAGSPVRTSIISVILWYF